MALRSRKGTKTPFGLVNILNLLNKIPMKSKQMRSYLLHGRGAIGAVTTVLPAPETRQFIQYGDMHTLTGLPQIMSLEMNSKCHLFETFTVHIIFKRVIYTKQGMPTSKQWLVCHRKIFVTVITSE